MRTAGPRPPAVASRPTPTPARPSGGPPRQRRGTSDGEGLAPEPPGEVFVGRRAELAVIAGAVERARAGQRQVLIVSGEAGIGKTRLCQRAADRAARAGLRVVWGRCWPHGGAPPLWPWPAVLDDLAGPPAAGLLAEDPRSATVDRERFARFRAVGDVLARNLDGQPTLLIVDDVHAADEAALLLTRFLARTLDRVPLLLLLARRPADPAGDAAADRLASELERDAVTLALRRFGLADTTAFLSAHGIGDAGAVPAGGVGAEGLARTVLSVTGGSPLLLRRFVTHGSPSPGLSGVEQALAAAVAAVSPAGRRVLGLFAVLGRTASVHDIAYVAGQPAAEVLEALAEAARAGLVEAIGLDRHAFGHDLIQQAAAATLTAAQRLDAHARAATLVATSNRPDQLARRSHHALAAAARSESDARAAVRACRAAARAMRAGFDYQQAAALLDAAVGVADTSPGLPDRAVLFVERAEALLACGRLAAARTAFADAAREAVIDGRTEPTLAARAALGLGGVWLNEHRDPVDRRRVLATQRTALDRLPHREAALRSRLAVRLAAEGVYDGDGFDALHLALAQAREVDDGAALAEALSLTHHAKLGPEHAEARRELAEELITVASAAGAGMLALLGMLWRTVDLYHLGDPRAAVAHAELRERAEALGCQSILYIVAAMDVMRCLRAGRLAEAEAAAGACLELGLEVGDADAAAYYGAHLSTIRWVQGRDAELLDAAAAAAASPTLASGDFAFRAVVAAMYARVGRAEEARTALDALTQAGLDALPTSSTWLTGMVAIAEAAALLGDTQAAAGAYDLLAPFADLPAMPSLAICCLGSTERALGMAATALGELDRAVGHLERAVEANRRLGNRPVTAITQADLARALTLRAGAGDLARARALWRQAQAEAEAMDLPLRAERWAAGLAGTVGQLSAGQSAELTRGSDGWTVQADDRTFAVPDLHGLRYLAVLLERPGVAVSALELCGSGAPDDGHQELVDRQALDAYRRRLRELDADLAEAEADSDLERAHRLSLEREALREHLARVLGLGGRPRAFASSPERARTAVRKAIKRALDALAAADSDLGAELAAAVTTGTSCQYTPDPTNQRRWVVR